MYFHLGVLGDENRWFMIHGYDLLALLDQIVVEEFGLGATAPGGAGTLVDPFEMSTSGHWRTVGATSESPRERFYRIGGRIIRKDDKNYTSDGGLVTGFDATGAPQLEYGFGPEGGPSYREYRNYIRQLNDEVQPHTMLATLCRAMLRDDPPPLPPVVNDNPDRARAWNILPVLTATMFISETIRNNRSLPINLMLLDLIESGATYNLGTEEYTLEKAVWNPEEPLNHYGNKERLDRPLVDNYGEVIATTKGELNNWGGTGAMTQTNAVNQAKVKLATTAKGAGTGLGALNPHRPMLTLAQQKEVSLILNWLKLKGGDWVPRDAQVHMRFHAGEGFLPYNVVTSSSSGAVSKKIKRLKGGPGNDRSLPRIIMQIRALLRQRVITLDL